jgi:hypothetical protein
MLLSKVQYLRGARLSLTIALIGHLIFFNRCKEADRMEEMHALNEGTTFEIDLSNTSETSFFNIFDSVELVKLETTPNSIIKEVTRIIPYMNEMFILDATQNSVLRFDNNGKFLTRIQKIGNGPGEFTLLYDININHFSENLELLNPRGELLVFSRDGEFIHSFAIPLLASDKFAILTDDIILFYSMFEPKKLSYFSRKRNKIIKQEYEFPEKIVSTPLISSKSSPFNRTDSTTISFFQGFTNDIYKVTQSGLSLRLRWNFANKNFDYHKLPEGGDFEYYTNYLRNSKYVHSFNYYLEDSTLILTRFIFDKTWHTLILNKKTQAYRIIRRFTEKLVPPANPVLFDRGIITAIDPMMIQIIINEKVLNNKNLKILSGLDARDNPVVVKYYLKQNQ